MNEELGRESIKFVAKLLAENKVIVLFDKGEWEFHESFRPILKSQVNSTDSVRQRFVNAISSYCPELTVEERLVMTAFLYSTFKVHLQEQDIQTRSGENILKNLMEKHKAK